MNSTIDLLWALLLSSIFIFSHVESETVKEHFENMKGDNALARDFCLKESSMTTDQLRRYNDDEIPENYLCFFKCLYEKLRILDKNGKFDVSGLGVLPAFDKSKLSDVEKCLNEKDDVYLTCMDLKKAGPCLKLAFIEQ